MPDASENGTSNSERGTEKRPHLITDRERLATRRTNLDELPSIVADALDQKNEVLAVLQAIRFNIRDEKFLTDMVFRARHSALGKNFRIASLDQQYKGEWEKIRLQIVRNCLTGAIKIPPIQLGTEICKARENIPAKRRVEKVSYNLTGRYQGILKDSKTQDKFFTICLNQAGEYLTGYFAWVLWSRDAIDKPPCWKFEGYLQNDGNFLLCSPNNPEFWHKLVWINGGVELRDREEIFPLDRTSSRPTLMENSMRSIKDDVHRSLVTQIEWTPLTREQTALINNALTLTQLAPLLVEYFRLDFGRRSYEWAAFNEAAQQIDRYIYKLFSEFHPYYFPLVRFQARLSLSQIKWEYRDHKMSLLDWLQKLLERQNELSLEQPGRGHRLNGLRDCLSLKPKDKDHSQLYEYEFQFFLEGGSIGAGAGAGASVGAVIINQVAPIKQHIGTCALVMFEASFGPSVKIRYQSNEVAFKMGSGYLATGKSYNRWNYEDFEGRVTTTGGGAWLGLGLSVQGSKDVMYLHGNGVNPEMELDTSPFSIGMGVGGGIEASKGLGYLWATDAKKRVVDESEIVISTDFILKDDSLNDIHFCLDSALLTEPARQLIRVVCANELMNFMSDATVLTIEGHADRTQTDAYNKDLTAKRAQNTLHAIEEVLGKKFDVQKVTIGAKSFSEAVSKKHPPNTPFPADRRVDIIINSRLVLSLRAQK